MCIIEVVENLYIYIFFNVPNHAEQFLNNPRTKFDSNFTFHKKYRQSYLIFIKVIKKTHMYVSKFSRVRML